jgi:hypothetical protein
LFFEYKYRINPKLNKITSLSVSLSIIVVIREYDGREASDYISLAAASGDRHFPKRKGGIPLREG